MAVKKTLTAKQDRFIDEYLIDFNATQAAIRAGYSKKTGYSIGQQLLKKPEIQEELKKRQKKLQLKTGITQERVLKEMAICAFADPQNYFEVQDDGSIRLKTFDEMPPDSQRAIASVKEVQRILGSGEGGKDMTLEKRREYKFHSKTKNLENLGRHLGLFNDKVEVSGGLDVTGLPEGERKLLEELAKDYARRRREDSR